VKAWMDSALAEQNIPAFWPVDKAPSKYFTKYPITMPCHKGYVKHIRNQFYHLPQQDLQFILQNHQHLL
jgi:hypothetical protein